MAENNVDLSYLQKATISLNLALEAIKLDPKNDFIRDSCIQRFEFCYELSHKTLKRYLEFSEPTPELIDQMSFPDLIRTASEKGLLKSGWDVWQKYRHARNIASHTYDEKKAREVLSIIPEFFIEIQFLLTQLAQRLQT